MRADATGLENIRDDPARVNGSYLYAALEELRVLHEFHECKYRQHPKFHHFAVMHLFDTALPWAVFEAQMDAVGRDMLQFTRLKTTLTEHASGINRLESALGMVWQSLVIPTPATRACKRGGGKGVSMVDGMEVIK